MLTSATLPCKMVLPSVTKELLTITITVNRIRLLLLKAFLTTQAGLTTITDTFTLPERIPLLWL